ncbi:MAG: hypothetical protein IT529_17805 [Burkholderiales bacterium]|nr:hypothetical protein [Burkholderiales bacterium]
MIAVAPVLVLLLAGQPAAAAELGRLFYTPEQRVSLDAARAKRQRAAVATEESAQPAAPAAPAPEAVTYGGIVRRSDGKTTVWINNRPVTEKEAASTSGVRQVRPDGTVTLRSPQSGRNVNLQVGQRAELTSGTVEEGYLRAEPPKAAAAPDAAQTGRTDAAPAARRAGDAAATPAAESPRAREEIEQRERLEQAIRALQEAAANRAAGAAPAAPLK